MERIEYERATWKVVALTNEQIGVNSYTAIIRHVYFACGWTEQYTIRRKGHSIKAVILILIKINPV